MKLQLHHLEIHPGENGGFRVVHNFKRHVASRKGAMSGGIYTEAPPEQEHLFGPGTGPKMIAHVASALGVKPGGQPDAASED